MKPYKLIACDMDETLLSSDASICQRNITAIKKALHEGIYFVPCTGRGFHSIDHILKTLHLYGQKNQYVISFNGSCITENKDFSSSYWLPLAFDLANEIYRFCTKYSLCQHIYTKNNVYIRNITPAEKAFLHNRMTYTLTDEVDLQFLRGKEEIAKLIITHTDTAVLHSIANEMASLLHNITTTYSSNRYLEFMPAGVNKGNGLIKLAELLHIAPAHTMAIGDNINDIEMLQAAGLAVGVHNLNPAIRTYCDVITNATNNEGAVAEAIERFILTP